MHTPGPWAVSDTTNSHDPTAVGVCSEDWIVADAWGDAPELLASRDANARLIAAAPELYAACKTFQRIWDGEISFDQQDMVDAENALVAAINKAEGK